MNEPNGLIRVGNIWHLFYQHNPFNNQWGNMSWGHAISRDLLHWEHQPIAIPGEDGVMAFSGTCVYDAGNRSGFGSPAAPPVLAFYTGWRTDTRIQDQRLAHSTDGGMTWKKYDANPILDEKSLESRDPKVLYHPPSSRWVMILAHGGQKRLSFWISPDAINWTKASDFRAPALPDEVNGWEVVDLFEIPIENEPMARRWVLLVTPATGSPAGGNGVFGLTGSFDGRNFRADPVERSPLWLDYGRDFDGVLSWENVPASDGRRIIAGVMNSYGTSMPTKYWRGQLSIPRELRLKRIEGELRLLQQPVREFDAITGSPIAAEAKRVLKAGDVLLKGVRGRLLDVRLRFRPSTGSELTVATRVGGPQRTLIRYNEAQGTLSVDRRATGNTRFHAAAGGVHSARLQPRAGIVDIRILLDECSVEVFGGEGEVAISDLIFPDSASDGLELTCSGGDVIIERLEIRPVERFFEEPPPLPITGEHIAHWSMDPLPHVGSGTDPVTLDSAIGPGQGTHGGTRDHWYEMNAAVEHLRMAEGGRFAASGDLPPAQLFRDGKRVEGSSFDAWQLREANGALALEPELYGDDAAFRDQFTVELFFKTHGDQSEAGLAQVILQGTDRFRYGLNLNEGGKGNVLFAVQDSDGSLAKVGSHAAPGPKKNFADGTWHYLMARYDRSRGNDGEMDLILASEDGAVSRAKIFLPQSFGVLPEGGDGRLLVGRHSFSAGDSARIFPGVIDEVRLTPRWVNSGQQLGKLGPFAKAEVDEFGGKDQ